MECRIQFSDNELQNFSWCKLQSSNGDVIASGNSSSDLLAEICSESSKVIVFFPQQDILLASPQLPPKATKQQLNAIAYNIEEFLAEDIEDCFFAVLSQQADYRVPVATVNRETMDNWVQFLTSNHINTRYILAPFYLCPWSDDNDLLATICPLDEGYLIRTGLHEGMFCQQTVINQFVETMIKDLSATRNRLVIFGELELKNIDFTKLNVEQRDSINLLAQPVDSQSCINLKQKDYQSSHQWLGLLKNWRMPMVAMVLLGMVYVAGYILDGLQKEKLFNDIIRQQQSVLSQYLPDLETTNQPKMQLIKALSESRGMGGQHGFVKFLHEYVNLRKGFNTVITDKILYQKSTLIINLETKDLNSLESFRNKLEESSFQVQIENVNINPDKTTGRLVMREINE